MEGTTLSDDARCGRLGRLGRLRGRHQLLRAVRAFFDSRGFVEVETPALVASPGLDVHIDAFGVQVGRQRRYLHTSPEFAMKRLVAEGLGSIYQIAKAFRVDELGHLHNPEFTLLEWYGLGLDIDGLIRQTETLVSGVAAEVNGSTQVQLATGGRLDFATPWPRISVAEAFERHAKQDATKLARDEDLFFQTLVEQVEPALDPSRPTVLHSFPLPMAALARRNRNNPDVADRFEVYAGGVELCNGFAELTCPTEQRRRFEQDSAMRAQLGKAPYPIDHRFLAALESGLPECAGNAIGIDRLAMLLFEQPDIASVMSFTVADT